MENLAGRGWIGSRAREKRHSNSLTSSRRTQCLRLLKRCNCFLARHGRKFIQELRQRFPMFQVVEQGLKQDASAAKDRLPPNNSPLFNAFPPFPPPPNPS